MAKRKGADPQKDIEKIIQAVEKNADGIRTVTFNTVKGMLVRRIFNNGFDSNGERIGQYKTWTKIIRNLTGRRIDTVDLEFTGTLRRSVTVGVSEDKVVLGLIEQQEPKITIRKGRIAVEGNSLLTTVENAILQEEHFESEIFAPSKEEIERGEKTVLKELDRTVRNALKQS